MDLHYWYVLSVILFLLEAFAIPGIGLFFAGFGALTVALLVQWGVISAESHLAQYTAFFLLTGLWMAILWTPLKKFRIRRLMQHETHHDVIGRMARVKGESLRKNQRGTVEWSGTLMAARLADDAAIEEAAVGIELKIVAIEGSTLILAEPGYSLSKPRS